MIEVTVLHYNEAGQVKRVLRYTLQDAMFEDVPVRDRWGVWLAQQIATKIELSKTTIPVKLNEWESPPIILDDLACICGKKKHYNDFTRHFNHFLRGPIKML